VLTSITVTPDHINVAKGANQVFVAQGFDQFGQPIALGAVTWSSSAGNVSPAGMFRSSNFGQSIRVTATVGSISGFAIVNVVQTNLDSAFAWPVPFKPAAGHTLIHFDNLSPSSKIKIFTAMGALVKELSNDNGGTSVTWNVKNETGENVASGVYLFQIKATASEKRGKIVIIR